VRCATTPIGTRSLRPFITLASITESRKISLTSSQLEIA